MTQLPHRNVRIAAFLVLAAVGVRYLGSQSAVAAEIPAQTYWVYIGTYTGEKGSKGIYRCRLDTQSGRLSAPELAAEVASPSFLAISPDNRFLYAVGETSSEGEKKEGTVHAYAIDGKTGSLKELNSARTGGPGPCHLSVNETGRFLIVANYGGGSTALFRLKEDGSIERQTDFVQHQGSSANKERQEAPHAHCAVFATAGDKELAYVADLGLDKVLIFHLDRDTGKLSPANPPFVKLRDGSGPRHLVLNSSTGKAYVCGEIDSTLTTLRYDPKTGALEEWKGEGAVLSTLPKDVTDDVRKKNSTAEVVLHPSKRHVFVSNRGHDSIAVFGVTAEKTEAGPYLKDEGIKTPRSFNIDPSGKWILVASQDGDTVEVFEWDEQGGNGKSTGRKVDVSKPVCVVFVPIMK